MAESFSHVFQIHIHIHLYIFESAKRILNRKIRCYNNNNKQTNIFFFFFFFSISNIISVLLFLFGRCCVCVHIYFVFLLFFKQRENAHIIFYFVPLYIYRKRPLLISLEKEAKRIMCLILSSSCFVSLLYLNIRALSGSFYREIVFSWYFFYILISSRNQQLKMNAERERERRKEYFQMPITLGTSISS